jgi:hypothetical protein
MVCGGLGDVHGILLDVFELEGCVGCLCVICFP